MNYVMHLCTYFIAVLLAALVTLSAQEPCATDCSAATAPYSQRAVSVDMGGGCAVTLTIRTRVCSGIFEVEIVSAAYTPGCATTGDPRVTIERAIRQFVTTNGMQFPTGTSNNPNAEQWVWRVARPACWQVLPPQGPAMPCGTECCISYLTVMRKANCSDWAFTNEARRNITRNCPLTDSRLVGGDAGANPSCATACDAIVPGLR
jgi:hypothetical protein